MSRDRGQIAAWSGLWLIVGVGCALPLAWAVWQLLTSPTLWASVWPDSFRFRLLWRTFLLNGVAASVAVGFAVAPALVMGLTRAGRWLWWVVPIPLVLPSLVLTYGWSQALVWIGQEPRPQSALDVTRCVVALASWLWPAPAMIGAVMLRRVDPAVWQLSLRAGSDAGRLACGHAAGGAGVRGV
jgi:ABC-type Fe3+ transport system permease subunit